MRINRNALGSINMQPNMTEVITSGLIGLLFFTATMTLSWWLDRLYQSEIRDLKAEKQLKIHKAKQSDARESAKTTKIEEESRLTKENAEADCRHEAKLSRSRRAFETKELKKDNEYTAMRNDFNRVEDLANHRAGALEAFAACMHRMAEAMTDIVASSHSIQQAFEQLKKNGIHLNRDHVIWEDMPWSSSEKAKSRNDDHRIG
ncbi:hypothetical protein GCM10011332_32310 [Terasakiella brassicae]|uniref:Uncharacterized protein n=2 Tax=Terasakiella brassicae TaxID=1634917 RepID=A0A917C861_9PROT|nr:hypothetical protein GCM10011332_32310 [Terasakiella brassicae]